MSNTFLSETGRAISRGNSRLIQNHSPILNRNRSPYSHSMNYDLGANMPSIQRVHVGGPLINESSIIQEQSNIVQDSYVVGGTRNHILNGGNVSGHYQTVDILHKNTPFSAYKTVGGPVMQNVGYTTNFVTVPPPPAVQRVVEYRTVAKEIDITKSASYVELQ